jgi:hypothetical protein
MRSAARDRYSTGFNFGAAIVRQQHQHAEQMMTRSFEFFSRPLVTSSSEGTNTSDMA